MNCPPQPRLNPPRRWRHGALVLLATTAAWLLEARPARADLEYWNWTELRVPLASRAPLTGQPVHWRVFSDLRWGLRYPGLGWNFFRAGPLWTIAPWLIVGTQGTSIAVQSSPGVLLQEYRAEFEPTVLWRWGDFAFSDRNRLEYRWRFAPGVQTGHVRYRNQLRMAYAPPGASWLPFAWNEPLIEFNGEGFAQNRAEIGVGYQFTPETRFDVGVMWRSRAQAGTWDHDAILNAYLYYAPAITPLFDQR